LFSGGRAAPGPAKIRHHLGNIGGAVSGGFGEKGSEQRAGGEALPAERTNHQRNRIMLPKYTVEYGIQFKKHSPTYHYSTDDPVACEEFLTELLERGFHIIEIKHEGLPLSRPDFDKMLKSAASMLASRHLCASLRIKPEEERFRFGFAA
jgi:hypothetical protein